MIAAKGYSTVKKRLSAVTSSMSTDSLKFEKSAANLISEFVLQELPLAVYDPNQPRRTRVPVTSFSIELLEFEEEEGRTIACAAGPVVLDTPTGAWENHLRLYIPLEASGPSYRIANPEDARATYIVLTDAEIGACKETAALANALPDAAG